MTDYIDYRLKTVDVAAMQSALFATGIAQVIAGELAVSPGYEVDIIGEWLERTGGTDEEPEYSNIPGYHFNVRSTNPINWPEGVQVMNPSTPWRVWL